MPHLPHETELKTSGTGAVPRTTFARQLVATDLVANGLTYVALLAPLSTLGFVWQASGGLISLAYLVGLVCIAFTAWSYCAMAREFPSAGSAYAYARQALGPHIGFMAGWLLLLDYLLIPALVFVLMSVTMAAVVPAPGRLGWLGLLAGFTLLVNWFGIGVTSRVNRASVLVQGVFLLVFLALCLMALKRGAGTGGLTLAPLWPVGPLPWSQVAAGAAICMLSFLGFDAVSTLAEEVRAPNPAMAGRLVARATLAVLGISGSAFLVTTAVLGNLMPGVQLDDPATAILAVASPILGPAMMAVLAGVLVWVVGFTNALPMQAGVARVIYAMARDRQLPQVLARVHPRHQTPHGAMLLASGLSLVVAVAMMEHAALLTEVVNFGALGAFALVHLAVLVELGLRRRAERRWLAHGVAPLVGVVLTLGILAALQPAALWAGAGWLALGGVVVMVRLRGCKLATPTTG